MSDDSFQWERIERHGDGVAWIVEPLVRSGLVEGDRDIAIIDTGMGATDFRAITDAFSDRDPIVLQTHTHWDHIGGTHQYQRVMVHPAEADNLRAGLPHDRFVKSMERFSSQLPMPPTWDPETASIPGVTETGLLNDGDTVDLGGRVLEVIHTPGHSPGGVSFFDRRSGVLFVGDVINMASMLLCLPGSDPHAFRGSLRRLADLAASGAIVTVVPGHGNLMTADDVRTVQAAYEEVYAGRAPTGQDNIDLGMPTLLPVDIHQFDGFNFLITPGALGETP